MGGKRNRTKLDYGQKLKQNLNENEKRTYPWLGLPSFHSATTVDDSRKRRDKKGAVSNSNVTQEQEGTQIRIRKTISLTRMGRRGLIGGGGHRWDGKKRGCRPRGG
jgi:hypothetical protein